ncbi:MAG: hypothetical protein ACJ8AT_22405 [Hyalangium sp.]|uniref:hypothetical protein n=1 Tax=Hyalangium sp. TaxID=2028555 RepID=UPI003899B11D
MGERWPPVYDATELQGIIHKISSREGLAKEIYAPLAPATSPPFFQGDVVALDTELPLLDEQGSPAAVEPAVSYWLVLGNSCDLDRALADVPFTQLLPIRELVVGTTPERVAALTQYRASRQFHLPDWDAGNRFLYADFLTPATIDRRGLMNRGRLTARMSRIGWMLLHACTVRFLCRDDGRFD